MTTPSEIHAMEVEIVQLARDKSALQNICWSLLSHPATSMDITPSRFDLEAWVASKTEHKGAGPCAVGSPMVDGISS